VAGPDRRLILAAVDAEAALQARIGKTVLDLLADLLRRTLRAGVPREQIARDAARVVTVGRRQAFGGADVYMRRALDLLDVHSSGGAGSPTPTPRGIPAVEEWVRPIEEYRHARITGLDALEAELRAITRAEAMADLDLGMARRDAYAGRLASAENVTGWRRIIHPERSESGTCGLCVAAADRLYGKGDLLPLHARCKCTVLPATAALDPGQTLNADEIAALYESAGSTGRQSLAKVRFAVREHGEIGPLLVDAGDRFTGPEDIAA